MNSTDSPMTARQLLARGKGETRSELLNGRLIERPFASLICGVVGQNLAVALASFIAQNDAGVLVSAGTGFQLSRNPDTVLAPSIGFVAKNRLPDDLSSLIGFFPGAPDLAVEVISPSETYQQVDDKVARYLEAGTRLVWVVRPRQQRVEVHRADGSSALLSVDETLDGEGVVPGFTLPIARIFG